MIKYVIFSKKILSKKHKLECEQYYSDVILQREFGKSAILVRCESEKRHCGFQYLVEIWNLFWIFYFSFKTR